MLNCVFSLIQQNIQRNLLTDMEYKLNMRRRKNRTLLFKRASDIDAICDMEFIMCCVHQCAWEGDCMLIDFLSKSRPDKKPPSNWPLVYRTNNIRTLIAVSTAV